MIDKIIFFIPKWYIKMLECKHVMGESLIMAVQSAL